MAIRKVILACSLLSFAAGAAFAGGVQVLSGLTREATLEPGGKTEGRIVVRNTDDKTWQVNAYLRDYLFYYDGRNDFGEPGTTPRSNCGWTTVGPKRLVLPPGQTASIYYTIQAPQDDKLFGTYWGVLMIEPVLQGTPAPLETEDGKVKIGLRTITRYAVQLVTNIGGDGKREIAFADKRLSVENGKRVLQLDIENTGDRWLKPAVRAELYDSEGVYVGRFEAKRCRIYPSCSVRRRIDLTDVPAGNYNALVIVDNMDQFVWGAQYDLEIK